MPQPFERVAPPESVALERAEPRSPKGINRSHLTLLLTVVGVISALIGAGLATWFGFYKWNAGEQRKTLSEAERNTNEAGKAQLDSDVNAIFREYNNNPNLHPQITAALDQFRRDPQYSPPVRSLTFYERLVFNEAARREAERMKMGAETKAALQDVEKKRAETRESHERTRRLAVDGDMAEEVTKKFIPTAKKSMQFSATGEGDSLRMFQPKVDPWARPQPIIPGSPNDPYRNDSNIGKK